MKSKLRHTVRDIIVQAILTLVLGTGLIYALPHPDVLAVVVAAGFSATFVKLRMIEREIVALRSPAEGGKQPSVGPKPPP